MRKYLPASLADIALVVAFCVIGRRSHDEGVVVSGLLTTLWPFLTGLAIGWIAVVVRGYPIPALRPAGVVIWFSTLAGGMVLRVFSGQGVALSFVVVAATVLAAFLLGWRAAYGLVTRRDVRTPGTSEQPPS